TVSSVADSAAETAEPSGDNEGSVSISSISTFYVPSEGLIGTAESSGGVEDCTSAFSTSELVDSSKFEALTCSLFDSCADNGSSSAATTPWLGLGSDGYISLDHTW